MAGFQLVYIVPWSAGLCLGFAAAVLVLRERNALSLGTFAALVVAVVGLLVGTKWHIRIGPMPPGELIAPGGHFPLGFLVGALLAGATCVILRVPWRATGDALAVAASVMISIGRIGCHLNGCCRGMACGEWALALHICISPARNPQPAGSALPIALVHPLPLYFALASLVTLGVLLWQLRRGARPGTLLATFCLLRPAAKLALETLRDGPSPDPLMFVVPAGVLAVTSTILVLRWCLSSRRSPLLPLRSTRLINQSD